LRGEGSGTGGNEEDDDLDANFLNELPTDAEAAKVAAEQRALMALFEMQRRDESARQLMVAERRATAQQRACHLAHRGNMAATREAAERQQEEDRARGSLARAREHQYSLPSFAAYEDAGRRQAREDRHRHRLETCNHSEAAPSSNSDGTSRAVTSGAGNTGGYY
jgi:hypothetical protein